MGSSRHFVIVLVGGSYGGPAVRSRRAEDTGREEGEAGAA